MAVVVTAKALPIAFTVPGDAEDTTRTTLAAGALFIYQHT